MRVPRAATLLALVSALALLAAATPKTADASISIADASLSEGTGGTSTLSFMVTLSAVFGEQVSAQFATADGSAVAPGDYTGASGTVMFAPGDTSKTVSVTVQGDELDEPDETLSVELSGAVGAPITDGTAVGTIADDDPGPSLSIGDVSVGEGDSGSASLTLTVSLSAVSGKTVTVDHATLAGTAAAGSDFTAGSGTITFTPGDTSKTVSVEVLGDAVDEANEALTVVLSNATGASIADGSATVTIADDDEPPPLPTTPAAPATGPAPPSAPAPGPDRTGPRLTKVRLSPSLARPGSVLSLGFKLDEAARVAGEVTLRTRGVRTRGGRCLKRTRTRRGPVCTRRVRAGTLLAARASVGENRGRLDLGQLRAGDYTLKLTPTDAAGNVGAAKLIAFRVRR